ncbi:MAG: hypothetical protein K9G49_08130 [Taibaiella sp.]|nr:hypothetical protein [Taibaiella sp.]
MDISVKYYNEAERLLFQAYPKVGVLNTLTANTASIAKDDLLAYMMFTEQGNFTGRRTYADLSAKIQQRLGDFDDHFTFNNGSIQARYIGNDMVGDFTERLGVGLGLCVVDKIEGLTQADWELIPIGTTPSFDYKIQVASTGTNFIQAENKGSIIANNTERPPTVSRHYSSIKTKKGHLREEDRTNNITLFSTVYYGTIGVLDNQNGSVARVWLVDPTAIVLKMDPYKFKLVARLKHYLVEFANVGVHNFIIKALEERISEIVQSEDYLKYNNVPIGIKNPKYIQTYMKREMYAAVDTNEAFGKIFIVEKEKRLVPFLIAYPKALIKLLINQNFEEIVKYQYSPDFMNESVQVLMLVWPKDYESKKMPDIKLVFDETRKRYSATYFGKINHDSSGRIFGLLDKEQELKYKSFEEDLD